MIDLSKNENTCNILDVKDIVNKIDFNRYSFDKNYKLLDELASFYNLNNDNFVLGNGSSNVIYMSLLALYKKANANIKLIAPLPTFELTIEYARNIGYSIDTFYEEFEIGISKINLDSNKTNVIYIANPNNPTGLTLNKEKLEYFNSICKDNTYMLFDEAYFEFANDYEGLELAKNPNILHIRTFSKMYSLAGIRIGYGISHSDFINIIKPYFSIDAINSIALNCAIYALKQKDFANTTRNIINENKKYLEEVFKELDIFYYKSQANFILHKIKDINYANYMKEQGIIVGRSIDNFPLLNRISIGNINELHEFTKALRLAKAKNLI